VHWLTWHEIAELFRTWQGAALAIIGAIATVYYGPRKVLETWDWYLDRFLDAPVLDIVRERKLVHRGQSLSNFGPPPVPEEVEYGLNELVAKLKRDRQSVAKSLKRLKRRGKIEQYRGGWRLKS
jgi:hypothetical protein